MLHNIKEMKETLAKYKAARDKILESGQSYKIGDREFTRADLRLLEERIELLESKIDTSLSVNAGKFKYATAVFSGRN